MKLSRAVVCALGALSLAACDIPTDVPQIDQRWIFPAKSTTIDVAQLLPAGVSLAAGGSAFLVNVGPTTVSRSLGQACPACAAFNGQSAAVPPFSLTMTSTASLPGNVASATISGGTVQVNVQNSFGFDPTTNGGSATITLTDGPGGRELGRVSLTGGTLPAGQTSRTLTLATGSVGSTITATTVISNGSGGQQAVVNTNNQITVTATPSNVQVSSARVNVANKFVSFTNQSLNVDISDDLVNHVNNGSLILTITNPFGVAMSANLVITVPPGSNQQPRTITRQVSVGAGATSSVVLSYTGDELRSFLGKDNVTLSGTGTVSSSAGQITVTPTQKVGFDSKLDLSITVG